MFSKFSNSLLFRGNESKRLDCAGRPPRPCADLPWWRLQPVVAVWENHIRVSLRRAHRGSECGLGKNGPDLPLLLPSVLVQGRAKHRLRRQGEPVETRCCTEEEEEERHGVFRIRMGMWDPNVQRSSNWAHTPAHTGWRNRSSYTAANTQIEKHLKILSCLAAPDEFCSESGGAFFLECCAPIMLPVSCTGSGLGTMGHQGQSP